MFLAKRTIKSRYMRHNCLYSSLLFSVISLLDGNNITSNSNFYANLFSHYLFFLIKFHSFFPKSMSFIVLNRYKTWSFKSEWRMSSRFVGAVQSVKDWRKRYICNRVNRFENNFFDLVFLLFPLRVQSRKK